MIVHPGARALATILVGIVLSGCAPMLAQHCAETDWYAAGVQDGLAGRPVAEPGRPHQACLAQRLAADAERYDSGRSAGLREYCTIEGGVRAGRGGATYQHVCAPATEDAFLRGYYLGALSPTR
jgi:hypothetical protein